MGLVHFLNLLSFRHLIYSRNIFKHIVSCKTVYHPEMYRKELRMLMLPGLLCMCIFTGAAIAFEAEGNQKAALEACDLPTNSQRTSHCFADSTHHTCCRLGPDARKYADASGNPIGIASIQAFEALTGSVPMDNETTSWCTCFGSLVCGNYASMFDDGTEVMFVYNKDSPEGNPEAAFNVPKGRECEEKTREYYNVQAHMTPGINATDSLDVDGTKCEEYDPADNIIVLL